jgi:DGQHR domain-containing protein
VVRSPEFSETHRVAPHDFTRKRCLSLDVLVVCATISKDGFDFKIKTRPQEPFSADKRNLLGFTNTLLRAPIMHPHTLARALRKLQSIGMTSEDFTRLHHFSLKGRRASLADAISYFDGKSSIHGKNLELARRCEYLATAIEDRSSDLPTLMRQALERFPLQTPDDYQSITNTLNAATLQDIARKHMSAPSKLRIAAAQVRQGELVLYATSIKVRDLVAPGFYNVETLDPDDTNDKGYQRLLNKARAKKLADYIVKGQDTQDAFLPTSVFLATHKLIPFDSATNTIEIDIGAVGPFSVVDGQHRLEGLKMAAEKDDRVLDFDVPVNIAIDLNKIAQMCHFLIVNTTQKSVDRSVEQRIIARLSDALDVEDLPSLPKWIFNTVEKGEVDRALKYVDYLNETEGSPWFGKVKMANSVSDDATVNQRSFVKAIVKYVLTANNPIATIIKDLDKERKIFLNYWKAIAAILDDGNAAVLYKYNGVELFCKFSIPFFIKLQDRNSFTASTMESLLRSCFENVEGDYAGVGHPEWWAKGGKSSFLNAGAINVVSQEMAKALHKTSQGGSIEI